MNGIAAKRNTRLQIIRDDNAISRPKYGVTIARTRQIA